MLAVAVAYIPVYNAGFIWDDDDYLTLNPLIVKSGGLGKIWDPRSGMNQQYYPMLYTSFLMERTIWGIDNARGFHLTNVVLHAANSVLLLLLLKQIGVPGAWLVAALFALHPVHVESVAWITERKNVLSAFFYLLAVLSFIRFDRTSRSWHLALSLLLFLLALFSKTVTASLPIALALVLWYQHRRLTQSRVVGLGAMAVIGLLMGLVTRSHEYRHVASVGAGRDLWTLPERLLVAGRAFWFYPWKILWPLHLSFSYDPWKISAAAAWQWLCPLSVVMAGILLLLLYHRGRIGRGPVAAALFYAASIFPALGLVRIAYMRFTPVSDHFTYLATVGILMLAVGGGGRLLGGSGKVLPRSRTWLAGTAAALVLAAFGLQSYRHARIFHDLDTLWEDTCRTSPRNWLGQLNYGVQLKRHEDYAGAVEHFKRVIQLVPPPSEGALLASTNLASVYFREGRYGEALQTAEECLKSKSNLPGALLNKGRALWKLGRLAEAEEVLSSLAGLHFNPDAGRVDWDIRRRIDDASVFVILGDVQAAEGKFAAARESYRQAVEQDPANPVVHDARVRALSQWGSTSEVISALRAAARELTNNTPFRLQLAWALSVAANASDRNGREALALSHDLVKELGERNAVALSILAAAQAEVGEFDQAAETARRARDIARGAGDKPLLARTETQQQAYGRRDRVYAPPSETASAAPPVNPGPGRSAPPDSAFRRN